MTSKTAARINEYPTPVWYQVEVGVEVGGLRLSERQVYTTRVGGVAADYVVWLRFVQDSKILLRTSIQK